jgi:hypothetical protein
MKKPAEFNWLTRLRQLDRGNVKRPRDLARLVRRAHSWPACACGQLCKQLQPDGGLPRDLELRSLGMSFADYVARRRWRDALAVFRTIERRTAYLLKLAERGAIVRVPKRPA